MIFSEKKSARQVAKNTWAEFLKDESAVSKIRKDLESLLERAQGRIVAYRSITGELDIFDLLLRSKRDTFFPRITGKSSMEFRMISLGIGDQQEDSLFVSGPFGIKEPNINAPLLNSPLQKEDVAIIPALACNPTGFRLGKGGGFYDRYKELFSKCEKIALLPKELTSLDFPIESFDLRLDKVFTECGTVEY